MADELDAEIESRPVWGAWIEIWLFGLRSPLRVRSRPVWGAWIEIPLQVLLYNPLYCRAPYGARGLKYLCKYCCIIHCIVAPRMGRVD